MGDAEHGEYPPWTDRLRGLLLPAVRALLAQSGIEGSGVYTYCDSRIRQGQVFLEYEIALARKLLSCGLGIRRADEVGSGFGQLMFLLGWNGFPVRFGPRPSSVVLTTNLVATCSRSRQFAVLWAMRRYSCVLSDVQRLLDDRREREEEPEALALLAETGLRDLEPFLDLGAGGRYCLFTNPGRRGLGLASALRRRWPA